jgi:hypothetical protein
MVDGRPLLFKDKEALQKAIDDYFLECENHKKEVIFKVGYDPVSISDPLVPTIAGLAYALKVDRQTIYNYSHRDDFFDTVKAARDYIVSRIENKLVNSETQVTGTIFLAKNYGYNDRQEIETINHNINENIDIDYSKLSEDEIKDLYIKKVQSLKND